MISFNLHNLTLHTDRDECAEMARARRTTFEDWDELIYCNHFCVNTPGSYECACRHGFHLDDNLHTCTGKYAAVIFLFCYFGLFLLQYLPLPVIYILLYISIYVFVIERLFLIHNRLLRTYCLRYRNMSKCCSEWWWRRGF